MTRPALLLPLLFVLTACGDQRPPPTTWIEFADRNVVLLYLLAIVAFGCCIGGDKK